jgi:hypothetical protein
LDHYQYALSTYENLIKEAPTPTYQRGLQIAFSRMNALRIEQQRMTAVPASPEVVQDYHAQNNGFMGYRATSLDSINPQHQMSSFGNFNPSYDPSRS